MSSLTRLAVDLEDAEQQEITNGHHRISDYHEERCVPGKAGSQQCWSAGSWTQWQVILITDGPDSHVNSVGGINWPGNVSPLDPPPPADKVVT